MDTQEKSNFEAYARHYQRMGNARPVWGTLGTNQPKLSEMPWLPRDTDVPILDVGCGWGHMLRNLWSFGYRNLTGIELSPDQAAIAKESAGDRATILCADAFEYLPAHRNHFGLLIMGDLIEHMPTPATRHMLVLARQALRSAGTIYIRTPNMSSCLASYLRHIDLTHENGFTEWSLLQLLDQSGFVRHQLVPDYGGTNLSQWRPWTPARGLGLRPLLNRCLHKLLYALHGQRPTPTRIGANLEVYSYAPEVTDGPD